MDSSCPSATVFTPAPQVSSAGRVSGGQPWTVLDFVVFPRIQCKELGLDLCRKRLQMQSNREAFRRGARQPKTFHRTATCLGTSFAAGAVKVAFASFRGHCLTLLVTLRRKARDAVDECPDLLCIVVDATQSTTQAKLRAFLNGDGQRRNVRRTPVDAMGVVLLVIVAAFALFGIGCTILGLLAERRQNWPKR